MRNRIAKVEYEVENYFADVGQIPVPGSLGDHPAIGYSRLSR